MERNLTKGKIGSSLLLFSLPMILGNLLQQFYNIADTLIVGKTIGTAALSAAGSAYTLMVLLTSIILGLCMGSGVVFARLYGAGKMEELKKGIVNSFFLVLGFSSLIIILSYLLLDSFVLWLRIPEEAAQMAREYLQIIFGGIFFVMIYNFVASVLRSMGNTLMPLVFLGISAVTNIVLDLWFILGLSMGIRGAALATVLAQALSAAAITICFFRKAGHLCPERRHFHYDGELFGLMIHNSLLTAVQQSVMNFGILMIQGLVNSFGFAVSAAFAVVVKIDAFAYMPAQDFGNAFATFVAQNKGAGCEEGIRKGTAAALWISILFCGIVSIFVCLFARPLMLLFVKSVELETITVGVQYLRIEGACYIGIGILFLLYGLYRGLGNAGFSLVLTVLSLGSRVMLAYTLAVLPAVGVVGIWWAIPIGWALADLVGIGYYCHKNNCSLCSLIFP